MCPVHGILGGGESKAISPTEFDPPRTEYTTYKMTSKTSATLISRHVSEKFRLSKSVVDVIREAIPLGVSTQASGIGLACRSRDRYTRE